MPPNLQQQQNDLLLFNLVLGKFLRQGKKAETFFAKVLQERSLSQLPILVPSETSTIYIALNITVFQDPT